MGPEKLKKKIAVKASNQQQVRSLIFLPLLPEHFVYLSGHVLGEKILVF
jgi:hypothetical protein